MKLFLKLFSCFSFLFYVFTTLNFLIIDKNLLYAVERKQTKVRITSGIVKPEPIAFVPLFIENESYSIIFNKFLSIIKNDLVISGAFESVNKKLFLEDGKVLLKKEPDMNSWKVIKTHFMICGNPVKISSGFKIDFKLYDIIRGTKIMEFSVNFDSKSFRESAHIVADKIYSRLTNESGIFNSKIVYVEKVPPKLKSKRDTHLRKLILVDWDGENVKELTNGTDLVMTPRFSPDGNIFAYLSYDSKSKKRDASIHLMNIKTGKKRPLLTKEHLNAIKKANNGEKVSMTYAPRFSPDGSKIVFSLILDGKSAIYLMAPYDSSIKRLTDHAAIDTSPCFSNDGKKIAFTSNRSGVEKIYVMDASGKNIQKISMLEGKYSQPVWSNRGDYIAFTKQIHGNFYIGLMKPNGSEERLIATGYMVEAPVWSPNGRYLMFSYQPTKNSQMSLGIADLTGHSLRILKTRKAAFDGAWSPLLNKN